MKFRLGMFAQQDKIVGWGFYPNKNFKIYINYKL